MDERTFQESLRARPPADATYRPRFESGVVGQRPGTRTRAREGALASGFSILAVIVAALMLGLAGMMPVGSAPAIPSPSARASELLYQGGGSILAVGLDGGLSRVVLGRDKTGDVDGFVPSPDGRSVAWIAREDPGVVIRMADAAGFVTDLAHEFAASSLTWSPDGLGLAFDASADPGCGNAKSNDGIGDAVDRDSQWGFSSVVGTDPPVSCDVDIVVATFGSPPQRTTSWTGWDMSPAWSPDGRRIAFVSDRDGAPGDIYTMTPDGSDVERVSMGGGYAPVWSPDGTRIAYFDGPLFGGLRGSDGRRRLIVADADGGHPTVVVDPSFAEQIRWSPDGLRLAYMVYARTSDYFSRTIRLVDVDGSDGHPLLAGLDAPDVAEFDPAWSPDGSTIAFTLAGPGGHKWGSGSVAVAAATGGTPSIAADVGQQPEWR